jgi:hypothetical protein
MPDDLAPPTEVLAFLVRALAPRALWNWLGEHGREDLQHRVALGFRATHEALRQPAARSRLVSHLEKTPDDFQSLLELWGASLPRILDEVRARDDEALQTQLPELQNKYGAESLLLALLHEEKTAVIEAWADAQERTSTQDEGESVSGESPLSLSKTEIEKLQKRLARETRKVEHWHDKYKDTRTRAATNEKALRDKLAAQEKSAREAVRQGKAESIRAANLEAKLLEAEKARERAERRARSTQAESESTQQEVKTLRRQLHRLQQINEELRGRLALVQEQREDKKAERREENENKVGLTQNTPTQPPREGEEYPLPSLWEPGAHAVGGGEGFRVSPDKKVGKPLSDGIASHASTSPAFQPQKFVKSGGLKIREAVDRNNEAFVATLRGELSTLRTHDAAAYKRLMKELRASGEYYARILHNPTARVLVDASNVARYDAMKKGRLQYLVAMREELRRHDFFPIVFIADASLPYFIDEPRKLRAMIASGEVLITASGQQADEVLARQARETGAYVVTNDRNFHFAFAPDFTPSRLSFRIEDGVVLLDDG